MRSPHIFGGEIHGTLESLERQHPFMAWKHMLFPSVDYERLHPEKPQPDVWGAHPSSIIHHRLMMIYCNSKILQATKYT